MMVVGLRFAILMGMSAFAAVLSAPVPVTREFKIPARGSAASPADAGDLPVGGDARASVYTTMSGEARQHWVHDWLTYVTPDASTHNTDDHSCIEEGSANVTRDTSLFDAVTLSSPTVVAYEVDLVVPEDLSNPFSTTTISLTLSTSATADEHSTSASLLIPAESSATRKSVTSSPTPRSTSLSDSSAPRSNSLYDTPSPSASLSSTSYRLTSRLLHPMIPTHTHLAPIAETNAVAEAGTLCC
jgi:hypothetical protein